MTTKGHLCRLTLIAAIITMMMTAIPSRAQQTDTTAKTITAVQLYSNALYDLALCPNIGVEVQTAHGIAWQLDYIGAWWNSHSHNRYFSNYGFQTEARYYPQHSTGQPYCGRHFGIYLHTLTYDFEFGGTGYQSKDFFKTMGAGISYGYRKALTERLAIDFTVGIGVFSSKYLEYKPAGDWYAATRYSRLTWVGPTKLEVSLVWNIKGRNRIKKEQL